MKAAIVWIAPGAFAEKFLSLLILLHISVRDAQIQVRVRRRLLGQYRRQDIHRPDEFAALDRRACFIDLSKADICGDQKKECGGNSLHFHLTRWIIISSL